MYYYKLKDDSEYTSISLQGVILYKDKWIGFIRPVDFNGYDVYIEKYEGETPPIIKLKSTEKENKKELKVYNEEEDKKVKKSDIIKEILDKSTKYKEEDLKGLSKNKLNKILLEIKGE